MHELTPEGSNADNADDARLPAPEYPLLTRLDQAEVAELIEEYIDYINKKFRSVHLPTHFVQHFVRRTDTALPLVTGVATLPILLINGTMFSGRGLDRERGIVFRVPDQLRALIPSASECTGDAVAAALDYLMNEWLCDVATDYKGKCILIAIVATIIERTELPERPAFFIVAGNRGSGKTTVLHMISVAVLGARAAASGWSPSDEERRKALLAYFSEGVAIIAWDNIPRGTSISCPSIEKALTTETYTDRVLGVTKNRSTPATAIQLFTGNNISPRGDLASRSILVRLLVHRRDPENREFKHPDPIGWTENNRARILQAIYTILLGNPRLLDSDAPPAETRFKTWFHLVGSAIENAARQHAMRDVDAEEISFREIFLEGEADEEQTDGTATALSMLRSIWPNGFKASDLSMYIGSGIGMDLKGAIEQAAGKSIQVPTATVLTWRLKALVESPTEVDGKTLTLRYTPDQGGHGGTFRVVEIIPR
jgi:hypothetical protein